MKPTLQSLVYVGKDQISCELQGEAAILQLKAGMYYGVDVVGAHVWKFIQRGGKTVEEIRDALMEEYEVERERCEKDLLTFLERLREADLIRLSDKG